MLFIRGAAAIRVRFAQGMAAARCRRPRSAYLRKVFFAIRVISSSSPRRATCSTV